MSAVADTASATIELERGSADPVPGIPWRACASRVLKRCYERFGSAIFDPDGDVMRL